MEIGDVLKPVGNAFNEVRLTYDGHGESLQRGWRIGAEQVALYSTTLRGPHENGFAKNFDRAISSEQIFQIESQSPLREET
jgi:hypothetical protein